MDKFIIDRQFGIPIWVDVENGIVTRCYNESPKFIEKMHENYKGKSISFLKEDFESRMKPTYHNVRPEATYVLLNQIDGVKVEQSQLWNKLTSTNTRSDEEITRIKEKIDALFIKQRGYEKKLETEKERLLKEHEYKM